MVALVGRAPTERDGSARQEHDWIVRSSQNRAQDLREGEGGVRGHFDEEGERRAHISLSHSACTGELTRGYGLE